MTPNSTISPQNLSAPTQVLVTGATGGVGQLTVRKLLEKGLQVRILARHPDKAQRMFGNSVDIIVGDIRVPHTLSAVVQNVTHILCCTGTTAFPSARWEFESLLPSKNFSSLPTAIKGYLNPKSKALNSPEQVDAQGVRNLVIAAPKTLERFVLISTCGVQRKASFPFAILNAFGVLDAKQQGEEAIIQSGLPYTILRPGRLIDGPYTSYDLNTLMQAKTEGKLGVVVGTGDRLTGQTSRIDLAAACVECLFYPEMAGQVFELVNQGPRPPEIDWETLFSQVCIHSS